MVDKVDDILDGQNKCVNLLASDYQRRSHFQHHKVVAAYLGQEAFTKKAHDQDLAKHGGMNFGEAFKGCPQRESARSSKFNAEQKPFAAHFSHHLIAFKSGGQSLLQLSADSRGSLAKPLAF